MPYVVSWPDNTFLAEFSSVVTAGEIEAVNHAFSGDARMETVRHSVWDFSRAVSIDMPDREIESAAGFDKGVSYVRRNLKGALIVADERVRAVIEKYLTVAADLELEWDTRVFGTIEAARQWLEGGES